MILYIGGHPWVLCVSCGRALVLRRWGLWDVVSSHCAQGSWWNFLTSYDLPKPLLIAGSRHIVDADELLFCPQAADSVAHQRAFQQRTMETYHSRGVEEMRFVRIPYSGL